MGYNFLILSLDRKSRIFFPPGQPLAATFCLSRSLKQKMKNLILTKGLILISLFLLSCSEDGMEDDILPKNFEQIQLRPDEIYIYNGDSPYGTPSTPCLMTALRLRWMFLTVRPPPGLSPSSTMKDGSISRMRISLAKIHSPIPRVTERNVSQHQ